MELQIQDLINAIKKDGVDAAQQQAENIIAKANKQAQDIIAKAEAEAERIVKNAENREEVIRNSIIVTAEHARRDALLSFKESVRSEFEKILGVEISKSLKSDTLATLIAAAISGEDPAKYQAEVSEVTEGLKQQLAAKIRDGLVIRVNPELSAGFRLSAKDGSGYFDCSDEEILQMLVPYFSDFNI